MSRLDVHPHDLTDVRKILAGHVPEYDVYAFGSRVAGKTRKASDLDLAVMTHQPLDTLRMADMREAFSESDLPFKVDIADWAATKENFRKIIRENRFKIQIGKKQK